MGRREPASSGSTTRPILPRRLRGSPRSLMASGTLCAQRRYSGQFAIAKTAAQISGIMKLLINQNVSPRTTAAAIRRELSQFAASQSRDGRGPLKRNQVYRGRPDGSTGSQGGSADRSIKERGG